MKIRCERCGGDLTKTVRTAFARYDAGPIECPDCHAIQSRCLTEIDFLIDQMLTLFLMLGLVLLIPIYTQALPERVSVINLILLGAGILILDQTRLGLYRFSRLPGRPLSAQAQLNIKNRCNASRFIGFAALVLALMIFNKLTALIGVLIVSLILVALRLLVLIFHR